MFRFSAISRIRRLQPVLKRSKSTKSSQDHKYRKMADNRAPTFIPGRHWVNTRLQTLYGTGERTPGQDQTIFTVVSYNILAQDLLETHRDLYQGIPEAHLKWQMRKTNLIQEITTLRPDILCLQEIQCDHLEGFSDDLLQRFTFERVFKKRTGIEKTDGCAIFFNSDMFELIDVRTIEFNQQISLLDRDNVGIVVKLRSKSNPNAVFIVATTHLLFNPKRLDIKLAQVHVLLAELEQMAFNRTHDNSYYPIILTGDFNMEPSHPPYSLIADGQINYTELPEKQPIISNEMGITNTCQHVHSLKYGRVEDQSQLIHSERQQTRRESRDMNAGYENLYDTGHLSHSLHLTPAYRQYEGRTSTHHHDWIIVDYLFYSRYFNQKFKKVTEGPLKLLSYLELPSIAESSRMQKMPNEVLGSDHFSLAAQFVIGSSTRT